MITATHNCAVSVLVEYGREKAKFVKINEIEDFDSINATKQKKPVRIIFYGQRYQISCIQTT